MKNITLALALATASALTLSAQVPEERPEPSFDAVIAHLDLQDSQITCLETNQQSFREAARPVMEEIRDLKLQLRQAARNEEDVTAIQSAIEAERSELANLRQTHQTIAQGCLDASQAAALAELVAAETLIQEVRQGQALLLVGSTAEPEGQPGPRNRRPRGRR